MGNNNEKENSFRKKVIDIVSYVSLILWLIFIWIILYLILYKDFKWDDLSNLYIIVWILFLFWFLGWELVDIFKDTIRNKIEKYIDDNKNIFENKIIDKAVDTINEIQEDKENMAIDNNITDKKDEKYKDIFELIEKELWKWNFIQKQTTWYLWFWKGKTKFLELYTKDNSITFRLRHKNNTKLTTDFVNWNNDFKLLWNIWSENEYWNTIFRDYKFDIKDKKATEKWLNYLKQCFDWYSK